MVAMMLGCVVPVAGPVVRQFEAPACERCAGHRGITIGSTGGAPVVAVAEGTIRFVGTVGGRVYVVQQVGPEVLVTYGDVDARVEQGVHVKKGQTLARAGESTYLSVRQNGVHREPLRALGFGRARLVGPGNVEPTEDSR